MEGFGATLGAVIKSRSVTLGVSFTPGLQHHCSVVFLFSLPPFLLRPLPPLQSLSCCCQSMCTLSKPPHADDHLPHICAWLYRAFDLVDGTNSPRKREKTLLTGWKKSRRVSPLKGGDGFYLVYLRTSAWGRGEGSCEPDSNQKQQDAGKLNGNEWITQSPF